MRTHDLKPSEGGLAKGRGLSEIEGAFQARFYLYRIGRPRLVLLDRRLLDGYVVTWILHVMRQGAAPGTKTHYAKGCKSCGEVRVISSLLWVDSARASVALAELP